MGSADPEVEGTQETTEKNEGSSRVAGYEMDIEEDNLDDVSEEPLKEEEKGTDTGRTDGRAGGCYQKSREQQSPEKRENRTVPRR